MRREDALRRGRRRSGRRRRARNAPVGLRLERVEQRRRDRRCGRPSRRRGRSGGLERLPPPAQATLTPAVASAPRVRRPRRPRRRGDDRRGGARACSARRSATSSSSSSTTARSTRHRRLARGSRTTPRLRVVRNDEPLGPRRRAQRRASTRRADGTSRGWTPTTSRSRGWLETQRRRASPPASRAVVGTGMIDLAARTALGTVHRMPAGAARGALGSALLVAVLPLDRRCSTGTSLDRHGLRYDTSFGESEDYDLWARLLDGRRRRQRRTRRSCSTASTTAQASARRSRAAARVPAARRAAADRGARARSSTRTRAELAWRVGAGLPLPAGTRRRGGRRARASSSRRSRNASRRRRRPPARRRCARSPARDARAGDARDARCARRCGSTRRFRSAALARVCGGGATSRAERAAASAWPRPRSRTTPGPPHDRPPRADALPHGDARPRSPDRPELDLTVVYAGSTVQRRTWDDRRRGTARCFLDGRRVPGAYRVAPPRLPASRSASSARSRASRPEVVVVSGWSTFASQAAVGLVPAPRRPLRRSSSSRTSATRGPGWRRAVKGAVVPTDRRRRRRGPRRRVARARVDASRAASTAERISVVRQHDRRRAASAARRTARAAARRAARRGRPRARRRRRALRRAARAREGPRHARARGRARRATRGSCSSLAGSGPSASGSRRSPRSSACGSCSCPDIPWERIVERYVVADVFALLSRHEPWGVVVNEAAACGLPLVLSDRVGAAFDLLEDGRNGALVPVDDAAAAGDGDPRARRRPRAPSRDGRGLARDRRATGATSRASRTWCGSCGASPAVRLRERLARRARPARRRPRPTSTARAARSAPSASSARSAGVAEDARDRARPSPRRRTGRRAPRRRPNDAATPVRSETTTGVPTDGRLGRDEPEVLAARGEHEHVRPPVEVERRARRGRQQVDAAGGRGIGDCAARDERHRPVPVVRAGEDDVDVRQPCAPPRGGARRPSRRRSGRRRGRPARRRGTTPASGSASSARRRLGEGVRRGAGRAAGSTPARDDVVALASATRRSRAARPTATPRVERRVEDPLERAPSAAAAGTSRPARRRTGRRAAGTTRRRRS